MLGSDVEKMFGCIGGLIMLAIGGAVVGGLFYGLGVMAGPL